MKRKYLSALLMGVLTLSSVSTFTSCKDYDDDISNLQEQIDKLATADQLSQKVAELQALISSNKSDITSLQSELGKKTTLDEVKAVLADYATKEYVDGADATLKAAIDALETGKVAELEAAVKAAQAAADKAAADAEKANAEIVETLKTLATKAEVEEVQNAANTAIAAVESKNAEALEKAQAAILETLKGYATTQDLKEVADAAQKALDDAQKDNSKALADLDTAVKNAQSKANTAAADASKALADLVTTTKTANDAKKLADENKQSIADALKLLGEGYSAENTVAAAIKAIQAQVGTPNKELGTLDTRLAAIESVLNGVKDDDTKLGLATKVTNIENKLKDIIGEYTTMVTEVSLVGSFVNNGDFVGLGTSYELGKEIPLQYKWGKVSKDFTFGKAEMASADYQVPAAENQQTFVEGTTFSDKKEIVVRVNPTNAVLTKASIKLVDSQGNSLDDVLEIGEPKQFTKLLTTKAANTTGLWTIPVTVKNGVAMNAIEKKSPANRKHILYAVAVQNTKNAEDRYVASTYDITVPAATEFEPATDLNGVEIWSVSTMGKDDPVTLAEVKKTAGPADPADPDGPHSGTRVSAKSGEDIKISFEKLSSKIKYFYVVRDDSNVDKETSGSSAINAWNSYKYGGSAYGKVVEVNPSDPTGTINVTINGQVGDEIGFRIFAANYNGSLALENGASFVVYVGENQNQASVAGELIPVEENNNVTGWLPLNGNLKDGDTALPLDGKAKVNGKDIKFKVAYSTDGQNAITSWTGIKKSDVKYVQFKCITEMKYWKDDAKASFVLSTKNPTTGMVENEISVALTKKLPDAAYTKNKYYYTWKDEQLVNGKYTAYVYPTDDAWGTDVATGYKNLTQAITGLNTRFNVTIDGIEWNSVTKQFDKPATIDANPWKVTVDKSLVDGTTEHKTTISYNYGEISTDHKNAAGKYVVTFETVQTIFTCPLNDKDQTYTWKKHEFKDADGKVTRTADVNVLTYGIDTPLCIEQANGSTPAKYANLFDYIIGHNEFDNDVFGGELKNLVYGSSKKYKDISAKLISNQSKQEDYFKTSIDNGVISFHHVANAANPVANVKSTLVITLTDAFGHEMKYNLPFTVKKR